ncbi:putative MFS transporter [Aspergillus novofumigatus IBT 16806]|uniref:Putative MFS transporter n=1 Tax=Aspergillus novofumigatus (strain IBT 16806) TaxID=1392255 RepID=A0A2I1BXW2_ASPN1|nr:putative MFS transporter [Aspergillus novofumigatus IBT 16806]PKX90214.1 putative MFS transporter [Aspergillus novofumigatus IBT 16806]
MLDESRHDQSEETPLLGHNQALESGRFSRARWVLIILSLAIITVNFGSYLAMAPQIQIFESIICQKLHPEIALLTTQEQIDVTCKAADVQGELALVNGWKETLDTLPGIFLALPFGLMADQAGRKKVLMLSLIGLIMEEVTVRIIAWYSAFIPLRTVWFMSLFQICGGGSQIATSMILTMITDVFPVEKRANIFFIIGASTQVSEIVASPLSAWLMSWTPWLPYCLGVLFMLSGQCASITVPETLPKSSKLSEPGTEDDEADDDAPQTVCHRLKAVLHHARHQIMHHSRFIFTERNIVCISIALLTANVAIQSLVMTLQYVSKRFSWSMAEASFLISLKGIMTLSALLLILPALSKLLDRFLPSIRRDLRISLGSVLTIAGGHAIMALAASPTAFAVGLSISSLGAGFVPALRSVATALVDEAKIGLLGTTIALTQSIGAIIAGPMLAGTFNKSGMLTPMWMDRQSNPQLLMSPTQPQGSRISLGTDYRHSETSHTEIRPCHGASVPDVVAIGDEREPLAKWKERCGIKPENLIRLVKLAHMRYQHPDLDAITVFLQDFGMKVVKRTDEEVWYRGYGTDQYVYYARRGPKKQFLGGTFEVESYHDLERAANLPTGSAIQELKDAPGGGFMVTVKDPEGFPINLVYGQSPAAPGEYPPKLVVNYESDKPRVRHFQRFVPGPAAVHKLGHFGLCVQNFQEMVTFYTTTFNLVPSDFLYVEKDGNKKNVALFAHIDRGADYVDHHSFFMSTNPTSHVHHCSFEVHDFDTQNLGHQWLAKKGYESVWGVGRHILGSQLFDYWWDTTGNMIEHYADGDLVNEETPVGYGPAGDESLAVWGPEVPKWFLD